MKHTREMCIRMYADNIQEEYSGSVCAEDCARKCEKHSSARKDEEQLVQISVHTHNSEKQLACVAHAQDDEEQLIMRKAGLTNDQVAHTMDHISRELKAHWDASFTLEVITWITRTIMEL